MVFLACLEAERCIFPTLPSTVGFFAADSPPVESYGGVYSLGDSRLGVYAQIWLNLLRVFRFENTINSKHTQQLVINPSGLPSGSFKFGPYRLTGRYTQKPGLPTYLLFNSRCIYIGTKLATGTLFCGQNTECIPTLHKHSHLMENRQLFR